MSTARQGSLETATISQMTDSMQTTAERVEQASLNELRDVDVDDVYVRMDYLLQSRPTPLDLYNRWENQNWSTQQTFTLFFIGEQAVTDTWSSVRTPSNPWDMPSQWTRSSEKSSILGILPGFFTGFTAVARDESRHVNFGVRLMEAGVWDPSYLERVESTIFRLLESACRIVAAPDRRYAIVPEETPPGLLINPYDVRAFSLVSLTKRLRTAGLTTQACDEISKRGNLYYENAWNEYEDTHGEEHPRRYFDRLAPAAS